MKRTLQFAVCLLTMAHGCGPSQDGGGRGGDTTEPELHDEDGDGIADRHEGRSSATDTDQDGTPDYLDLDSDDDGFPDALEAGDEDLATEPFDSDFDSTPDFRDLDSDGNGIADGAWPDTADDLDGDGIGNWADVDDDGDSLTDAFEIGDAASPPDSDGDGIIDMHDIDSDGDTILDAHELAMDPDQDQIPAYLDDDSDDDCRSDTIEAGDAILDTPPVDSDDDGLADFVDIDSDNDGLADAAEDTDCDGAKGSGESSATSSDSDGDGVSDLVEVTAGTDPNDSGDNPQANGDFVFVVPYEDDPTPQDDDLDFSTNLQKVDVYVLMDLSGSMDAELDSVRDNMQTVLDNLTCPPLGSGDPATCIPDLWSGMGSFTYEGRNPFQNELSLQPDPAAFSAAVPDADNDLCPTGGCDESHWLALLSTITGWGSQFIGCSLPGGLILGNAPSCAGSPAGGASFGYPCFRNDAQPVILLATDEAPSVTSTCPVYQDVIDELNAASARVVGIRGDTDSVTVWDDLTDIATDTGTVDDAGTPLVFDGANAGAAAAVEDAVRTVANNVPIDISAIPTDDTSDDVDAVAAFVDRLETLQLGTPACASGLSDTDSDGDGFSDLYVSVTPGTPVCWKLTARNNTTVEATSEPQLFRATIEVFGDSITVLDQRDVYFLVPPDLSGPDID